MKWIQSKAQPPFTVISIGFPLLFSHSSLVIANPSDEPTTTLQPITVTADKVAKDKQNVSGNVSVFDGYMLEDFGISNLEEISNHTPNVSFYRADSHTTYLVYRGIGGTTNMNKVWNINSDGATLPYVATDTLLDVERIEIIRGSQGALYGRNTHAGVVNVVTRDPGEVFEMDNQVEFERFNTVKLKTAFGGPIDNKNGYRIALGYQSGDGFFNNEFLDRDDVNDHEQFSARGKWVYTPSDNEEITLTLTADQFDGGFDSYVTGGGYDTNNNEPGYNDGYLLSPTLTWEKQLSLGKLTSISNYSRSNYGFLHDWDFSQLDLTTGEYDENFYTFSQEFRLEGQSTHGLDWLFGAYLLAEKIDTETIMRLGADAGMMGMPPNVYQGQKSTINTHSYALFGQATYMIHPEVEISGRLRVNYEQKELDWTGFSDMYASVDQSFDENWTAVLPSVSLAWLFQPDQRIYASVSTGYKAGDYNNVQLDPIVVTDAVDPESTTTYELGYKGLFANDRFEFNTAFFYIDWEDLQVETPVSNSGALVYLKQNAAEAHSFGIEVELRARPAAGWDIFAGAGYLFEYEFDRFPNSTSGDLSGKKLPSSNKFNLNAGTVYRHPNGLFASVDAMLNGSKYFDEANQFEQKNYTLLNAKFGYEKDNLSVYLYGRNLLDEEYSVSMFANAEMAGEPLVVGVQASLNY